VGDEGEGGEEEEGGWCEEWVRGARCLGRMMVTRGEGEARHVGEVGISP
jgi:hypothetical protein